MFAKPLAKNPSISGTKQKNMNKPKTVSVKMGVKAPQGKKTKSEGKKSLKPPPRHDAGYCLYSSDGEDQMSTAVSEMEACEKILTQIKHKQKESEKHHKSKSKKKKKESNLPKALNENPVRTDVVPGLSSIYGTTYPYDTALFLRKLQSQEYASNPMFNYRLASSTPDPDKQLGDVSVSKLPIGTDQVSRDVPDRDISAVSSVPPSFTHLQNMADMVDIYKTLEFNKVVQLQEAAARSELEQFKTLQASIPPPLVDTCDAPSTNVPGASKDVSENEFGRESGGFIATDTLGYALPQADTAFRPVVQGSHSLDSNTPFDGQRNSSLTAFQPYLTSDSQEVLPPPTWLKHTQSQNQGHVQVDHQSDRQNTGIRTFCPQTDAGEINTGSYNMHGTVEKAADADIPMSGRSDFSDVSKASDYAVLPTRSDGHECGAGPQVAKVVYEKQNGLFQIHQKKIVENSASCSETKSDKVECVGKGRGRECLDEVPERDIPVQHNQAPQQAPSAPLHQSNECTSRILPLKNDSQNMSEVTSSTPSTSTPRNPDISGTGSSGSYGGRIVFIPNDSNTQNVIGYIPGLPTIPVSNQPISVPVTSDNALQSANILSSGVSQQGQSASQSTYQGPQEGSGYQSALHAQAIAVGDIGVRKLRYLLKELKECTNVSNVEVCRLVTEIDNTVCAIPQLALTFNLQTEIDLAIQPMRSENCQLRRKLRLLNQHVKEKELASTEEPKDINFELMHLQTSNDTLQKVLKDEKEIKTRLAAELQYLYSQIHQMKVEKSKLIAQTSEKETDQLKLRQEMTLECTNTKHNVEMLKRDNESLMNRLESIEKENHILQITLHQRDDEIARQSEIVETMKESIGDLLGELEQSRLGEKSWDFNASYGLNRLVKIVGEDVSRFPKEQTQKRIPRTPERRTFDFNTSDSTTSTSRLTRAALACHDREHKPVMGRMGLNARQGPVSESELDTLVELHLKNNSLGQGKSSRPGHRRTSSSSPVRLRNEPAHEARADLYNRWRDVSPTYRVGPCRDAGGNDRINRDTEHWKNTVDQEHANELELSPMRKRETRQKQSPNRRAARECLNLSPQRRAEVIHLNNGSEVSIEQSRYSVTDYFQKYHPQDSVVVPKEPYHERSLPPRGHPALTLRDNGISSRPVLKFRTSSEIEDRKYSEGPVVRNVRRSKYFKGMNDSPTISAINNVDDDTVSSVSVSSVTTANTVDDRKFRSGIATLDANIARLQQALQKTKSMLT